MSMVLIDQLPLLPNIRLGWMVLKGQTL